MKSNPTNVVILNAVFMLVGLTIGISVRSLIGDDAILRNCATQGKATVMGDTVLCQFKKSQ